MRGAAYARRAALIPALACLTLGCALLGQWGFLQAKGLLAQCLIERALARHLEDGANHTPWSWADHHPLALVEHVESGTRRVVIAGATGASMAFAAGHVDGTARPNAQGRCVIAGHRDGAFRFLGEVRRNDRLIVTTHGEQRVYRVTGIAVVSERDLRLLEPTAGRSLTLLTCFPLGAVGPTTQRLAITARPEPRDGAMNIPRPA